MQAVSNKHIRFVVFDPLFIVESYEPVITDEVLTKLGRILEFAGLLCYRGVPKDIRDMTVNLKSPIVINPQTRKAYQVILENPAYQVRHLVFRDSGVAG